MPTSIDYANLIRIYTYNKYGVTLVKTQVLKILYIIYGIYYAQTGKKLFTDDNLQAWPYGPVFPRVFRHYSERGPEPLRSEVISNINSDTEAVKIIKKVIEARYTWSAYQLSEWSHEAGGPWANAVYGSGDTPHWGNPISDEDVLSYFKNFLL